MVGTSFRSWKVLENKNQIFKALESTEKPMPLGRNANMFLLLYLAYNAPTSSGLCLDPLGELTISAIY